MSRTQWLFLGAVLIGIAVALYLIFFARRTVIDRTFHSNESGTSIYAPGPHLSDHCHRRRDQPRRILRNSRSSQRGGGLCPWQRGSGRFSPRNQYVARVLETGGFATLLLDLLTPDGLTIVGKCSTSICLPTACCSPRRGLPRIGRPADYRPGISVRAQEPGSLQATARRPRP